MAIRITGGSLGRRLIRVPGTRVRPTQDRVRAAVFSSLAERVAGARVLDLFAGSGALGLEAYSRGAACVWWVESDRRVLAVLKDNIRQLCGASARTNRGPGGLSLCSGPETRIIQTDVLEFLYQAPQAGPFDLIFADPPYDRNGVWLKKLLCALSAGSMLAPSGLFIAEQAAQSPAVPLVGWNVVMAREYGETRVCFLTR